MSFQISDIVIYGKNKKKREINLRIGEVNIITGASKTGKSALFEIVDYCLGSKGCDIPEGVIRRNVQWVGLKLKVMNGYAFIAREIPERGQLSSTKVYYDIKIDLKIPEYEEIKQNINFEAYKELLDKHSGITENIHLPEDGQTRIPLSASIRNALIYNFQQQTEVNNKNFLFHSQSQPFLPQAIKDCFPYFLGAVDKQYVVKLKELKDLTQKLKLLQRRLQEDTNIKGEGYSRAQILFTEAANEGLFKEQVSPESWEEYIDSLRKIVIEPINPEDELHRENMLYFELQDEYEQLRFLYKTLNDQLSSIDTLIKNKTDFSIEVDSHLARLKSIHLFEVLDDKASTCPLCESHLSVEKVPQIEDIKNSIETFENQVRPAEERSANFDLTLRKIKESMADTKFKLKNNRERMYALQESDNKLNEFKESSQRRAFVLGKIQLYLDTIPILSDSNSLCNEIQKMQLKIKELENEISSEKINEKLTSIISIISADITTWSKALKIEHSENIFRLDIKHLTVVADTIEGPIPMEKIGSGENSVGLHLVVYLALHKWFVKKSLPVPRFLFIDQPSQVYFPSDPKGADVNYKDEDRIAVENMFSLIVKTIEDLYPEMQIIITEHADLDVEWYQKCVVEKWRNGITLIPTEWYSEIGGSDEILI